MLIKYIISNDYSAFNFGSINEPATLGKHLII